MIKPLIGIPTLLLSCFVLSASSTELPNVEEAVVAPNEARARAILTAGLESNDFAVRIQAITAASMVGSNEAMVARLREALKDKNVGVRLAAIHALSGLIYP